MSLQLKVAEVTKANDLITVFRLVAADGARLPGWQAGAHIKLHLPMAEGMAQRAYSLINADPALDTTSPVAEYRIAVRREDDGRGGSRFLHQAVKAGDLLNAETPKNEFPLTAEDDIVLFAGGIGVTPILSMAAALSRLGKRYTVHYSGRSLPQLALVEEFHTLSGERLHLHADDDATSALNLSTLLAKYKPSQHLYVCGPKGMIDALLAAAKAAGWADDHLHFELFAEAAAQSGDQAFTLVLSQSGRELAVPADKTVLDVLIDAGLDPMFDCKRGECGVCAVGVVEGEVDHRDYCLSDAEKASSKTIQTCISRAKCARLVIDM